MNKFFYLLFVAAGIIVIGSFVIFSVESRQAELSGDVDDLVDFLNLFDNLSLRTNEIG